MDPPLGRNRRSLITGCSDGLGGVDEAGFPRSDVGLGLQDQIRGGLRHDLVSPYDRVVEG